MGCGWILESFRSESDRKAKQVPKNGMKLPRCHGKRRCTATERDMEYDITSRKNPHIMHLRRLGTDKDYRHERKE